MLADGLLLFTLQTQTNVNWTTDLTTVCTSATILSAATSAAVTLATRWTRTDTPVLVSSLHTCTGSNKNSKKIVRFDTRAPNAKRWVRSQQNYFGFSLPLHVVTSHHRLWLCPKLSIYAVELDLHDSAFSVADCGALWVSCTVRGDGEFVILSIKMYFF